MVLLELLVYLNYHNLLELVVLQDQQVLLVLQVQLVLQIVVLLQEHQVLQEVQDQRVMLVQAI